MHGAVEIRIPLDKGVAGFVATTGETLNIRNAYEVCTLYVHFNLKK